MKTNIRNKSKTKTIVVKLGTSVLTSGTAKLDRAHMVEIARQCAVLHNQGHRIVVVTSGAVTAGKEHLNMPDITLTVANKQMLAAVGQGQLVREWENLFKIYGLHVGQMLLTRADLDDQLRFINARDTLSMLLHHRIIPLINENDAVATREIKVGDNDNLSALVGLLADADQLLLLTDQVGLFTADPRSNPDAKLIPEISEITEDIHALAGDSVGGLGTGGMATKIESAVVAHRAGIEVVIASGHKKNVILDAAKNKPVGTRFSSEYNRLEMRKNWIFAGSKVVGKIIIDAGAEEALISSGASLLPTGVINTRGNFLRGYVVSVCNKAGDELARGIVRYKSVDIKRIKGLHSEQIEELLGFEHGTVVIHRDDLVLL
ncbi:glutamate 5-kinase [Psychromonas sp. Urea-02u-13]|uniref:glutamate 5-kinase n=1 Tax=Psychromonas sp. Urea-02u-13 TaxID=2058326 RepID=UPI000C332C97|nr:glutamate 5-kinase [Psychromonas sp. Urea-02u-13]PKG39927.1 glutamate 5-kinase [Psychromonas sp. Urea-02u-13]